MRPKPAHRFTSEFNSRARLGNTDIGAVNGKPFIPSPTHPETEAIERRATSETTQYKGPIPSPSAQGYAAAPPWPAGSVHHKAPADERAAVRAYAGLETGSAQGSRAHRCKRLRGPRESLGPMPGLAFAKKTLRWRLLTEGFSTHLPAQQQRRVVALAFRRWAAALISVWDSVLPAVAHSAKMCTDSADLCLRVLVPVTLRDVTWAVPWLSDGPGGELAHTSQPGEIHLDDDEPFSVSPSDRGVDLLQRGNSGIRPVGQEGHPGAVRVRCSFDTVFDWVRKGPQAQPGEPPVIWFNTYFLRGGQYRLYENRRGTTSTGTPPGAGLEGAARWRHRYLRPHLDH
ncbi:hypothetical protein SKAU_G00007280 [Synaphobranchus kaupii]|uniref:Peptidase M10 metallopeptidase domain-containing protein n=1 Tax=Synaphobranchus kaupii TaxID=118154 RepID=A0A9Q1JCL4_SYNKA|nr:hypothetical protein SKAU_G00007280 [Synaphobranchus kaupii]